MRENMLSLLDKLVEAIQTTSNPVDKIELYLEHIERKNELYNEFFWKKTKFKEIKPLVNKARQNIDIIINVLSDQGLRRDPFVKQLTKYFQDLNRSLMVDLNNLESIQQ
jgi:hypothetical protein